MTKSIAVKVGADPEVFLRETTWRKRYVSADKWIPGTKEEPHKLNKGAIQLDGTALEFNIDPASTREEFVENLNTVLGQIKTFVPQGYEMAFVPAVHYTPAIWRDIPEKCKELGCNPDFRADRNGAINEPPDNKSTMRTGSGHLHIGWGEGFDINDEVHKSDCVVLCQNLLNYFNVYENLWDKDRDRKRLYGAGGAFRPKPYGVEYRGLSNAWLSYPALWPWLFDSCQYVFNKTLAGKAIDHYTLKRDKALAPVFPL